MKQYKIIDIVGSIALCGSGSGKVYILTRDLPEGATTNDSIIEDKKGKLHICNIIVSPAD